MRRRDRAPGQPIQLPRQAIIIDYGTCCLAATQHSINRVAQVHKKGFVRANHDAANDRYAEAYICGAGRESHYSVRGDVIAPGNGRIVARRVIDCNGLRAGSGQRASEDHIGRASPGLNC